MEDNEYSVVFNESVHTAEYSVFEDTLIVYLPDGSKRETELKGLKPETVVKHHLMAYLKSKYSSQDYS